MNNYEALLRLVVGDRYGSTPINCMDQILKDRMSYNNQTKEIANLNQSDRIADIGSGLGWFAQVAAPEVESILCLDISEDFVNCIKEQLSEISNIIIKKMNYADLEDVVLHKTNKVFALSLFTQFSIYDLGIYLKEIHRVLPLKGILYFDFMNSNFLNVVDNKRFLRHSGFYLKDRKQVLTLLHWHGPEFIEKCLSDVGFKINYKNIDQECSYYCVEKIRD